MVYMCVHVEEGRPCAARFVALSSGFARRPLVAGRGLAPSPHRAATIIDVLRASAVRSSDAIIGSAGKSSCPGGPTCQATPTVDQSPLTYHDLSRMR